MKYVHLLYESLYGENEQNWKNKMVKNFHKHFYKHSFVINYVRFIRVCMEKNEQYWKNKISNISYISIQPYKQETANCSLRLPEVSHADTREF